MAEEMAAMTHGPGALPAGAPIPSALTPVDANLVFKEQHQFRIHTGRGELRAGTGLDRGCDVRHSLVQRGLIALVLVLAMAVWFSASAVVPAWASQWHLSAEGAAWLTAPVPAQRGEAGTHPKSRRKTA
jgi:hypothetical protein